MKPEKNQEYFTNEFQESVTDGFMNFDGTPAPQDMSNYVDSISDYELTRLDRYCKFDKSMPFYKIRIEEFIQIIN